MLEVRQTLHQQAHVRYGLKYLAQTVTFPNKAVSKSNTIAISDRLLVV